MIFFFIFASLGVQLIIFKHLRKNWIWLFTSTASSLQFFFYWRVWAVTSLRSLAFVAALKQSISLSRCFLPHIPFEDHSLFTICNFYWFFFLYLFLQRSLFNVDPWILYSVRLSTFKNRKFSFLFISTFTFNACFYDMQLSIDFYFITYSFSDPLQNIESEPWLWCFSFWMRAICLSPFSINVFTNSFRTVIAKLFTWCSLLSYKKIL